MQDPKLWQRLARKNVNIERLAAEVIRRPERLGAILSGLGADTARVRFGSAKILDRYLDPIPGPELITAANTIRGAVAIALAKPELADRIADEILKVEKGRYKTAECRNVVLGHALDALGRLFDLTTRREHVARFVKRQLRNPRNATRKRAERFVKRSPTG